ncbi:SURF1 family protein [Chelativorans intermedius]|uniref:SURF1-like protein n=1 Tax=Chelativorans intermedius TaxID=515947 RepID=A0ABV6DA83_9HYPH|nr:SURF1 family protein [Chelativorans intermedius]MCT8998651.1 SURF1 family protein [Chelativorans intermedius]
MSLAEHRTGPRTGFLLLAFSVPVLVLLLVLGTWQVKRLQWKEALIARIEERIAAAPVPLETVARIEAGGGDIDYRPVELAGAFLHEGERHYLATWHGRSGFFVHTPLRLADGSYIFVNRGFVPYDRKDPETRVEGQVPGTVQIGGLARTAPQEKPSFLVPDNDPVQNIFYWKDLDAMARSAGLSEREVYPFYVDADDKPNPGGLPVGGVTRINLPNNHLQYAITWYGLAFALVCVVGYWFLRRRHTGRT